MIELTLNKNYLSSSFDDWEDLFVFFDGDLLEIDEECWEAIRHYSFDKAPLIEQVYQSLLLNRLEQKVSEFITTEIPQIYDCSSDSKMIDYEIEVDVTSSSYAEFNVVNSKNDFNEKIIDLASLENIIAKIKQIEEIELVA